VALKIRLSLLGIAPLVMAATAFADERSVLTEFYHSTNGDQWVERDGWLEADNVCDWYGVSCHDHMGSDQRVARIELDWNGLSGSVPEVLTELEGLERLSLRGNALDGPLPEALVVWPRLPRSPFRLIVNLGQNRLTGPLPEVSEPEAARALDLVLDDNRLIGPLPESWSVLPFGELNLARNPLSATIPASWSEMPLLGRLNLASTQMAGPFPEALADLSLHELDFSDNELVGTLPDWLADQTLRKLNLEGNQLEGSIEPAVEAMVTGERVFLSLADNRFDGDLPERLLDLRFTRSRGTRPHNNSEPLPSNAELNQSRLDLCWNNFAPAPAAFEAALNEFHHGGSFSACQDKTTALSPEISGSWYVPSRAGEGFSQMLLDNGALLVYWFTYPPRFPIPTGNQAWYFGVLDPRATSATFAPIFVTSGTFGQGIEGRRADSIDLRLSLTATADGRLHAANTLSWLAGGSVGGITLFTHSSRSDRLSPLTRLAGSRCDNQLEQQWISGAWFNPDRVGEGFIVEVNEDGRGVVYWFTHEPDSAQKFQAWMTGDAFFDEQTLVIDSLLMPVGTSFGTGFNADAIQLRHWGQLTLRFDDDNAGQAHYESVIDDYGSGSFPIQRLARAKLAECD
jgi:hypothetical protein